MPSLTLYALVATFSFGPGQHAKVPLRFYDNPQQCVVASAKSAAMLINESTVVELRCAPMPLNVQGPPEQGEGRPLVPPEQRQREADQETPQGHPREEKL